MGREGAQRRLFVLAHEAAVAGHVGAEYGGELTLQYPPVTTPIVLPGIRLVKPGIFKTAAGRREPGFSERPGPTHWITYSLRPESPI
jgi:hypothetical protein